MNTKLLEDLGDEYVFFLHSLCERSIDEDIRFRFFAPRVLVDYFTGGVCDYTNLFMRRIDPEWVVKYVYCDKSVYTIDLEKEARSLPIRSVVPQQSIITEFIDITYELYYCATHMLKARKNSHTFETIPLRNKYCRELRRPELYSGIESTTGVKVSQIAIIPCSKRHKYLRFSLDRRSPDEI